MWTNQCKFDSSSTLWAAQNSVSGSSVGGDGRNFSLSISKRIRGTRRLYVYTRLVRRLVLKSESLWGIGVLKLSWYDVGSILKMPLNILCYAWKKVILKRFNRFILIVNELWKQLLFPLINIVCIPVNCFHSNGRLQTISIENKSFCLYLGLNWLWNQFNQIWNENGSFQTCPKALRNCWHHFIKWISWESGIQQSNTLRLFNIWIHRCLSIVHRVWGQWSFGVFGTRFIIVWNCYTVRLLCGKCV